MEQLMEKPIEMLKSGPRHARPVTLKSRLIWALDKGPTRWNWKTNLVVVLVVIGVLVGLGIAVSISTVASLIELKTR